MIKLPCLFSNGAVFQAESHFTLSGTADASKKVSCLLIDSVENIIGEYSCISGTDGYFEITLDTPQASFEEYSLQITCGDELYSVKNILFGEVWLASGQSNMELQNFAIPEHEKLLDSLKGKNIRVFSVAAPSCGFGGEFPWEPDREAVGSWHMPEDTAGMLDVSATGTKFAAEIYDILNRDADVPVAFLNASLGGTPILSWIPRDHIDRDPNFSARLKELGKYPTREKWNTFGDTNFQQTTAQFNTKIAPLLGIKIRGIIWYQGEFDTFSEFHEKMYLEYLRFYHKVYSELFAAHPESFLMLSSLLYRMNFGESGECMVAYTNNAFIEAALAEPDKFAFTPIADLEPAWNYAGGNNMLHPIHKYKLGERMASMVAAKVYGADTQKESAHIESYEICGDRFVLHTAPAEYALKLGKDGGDSRARGLYIAGEDGIYLPAECRITSPSTLEVWCDEIPEPKNIAYSVQSLETRCNIFAGDYPLAPFFSDKVSRLNIEARPWYDTSVTSVWVLYDYDDAFFRPVWNPIEESYIAHDSAFRLASDTSVRVEAKEGNTSFGCYIASYSYNRLDLQKFSALRMNLFNLKNTEAEMIISCGEDEIVRPITKLCDIESGWSLCEASLKDLPDGDIQRMTFRFNNSDGRFKFVNIEKLRLIK